MATFYQGYRPVLKGRDRDQNINTFTGEVEVYSNWSLMNPSHVLDGAPDHNHVPGEGYAPHGTLMTQMYLGKQHVYPMADPGTAQGAPYLTHALYQYNCVPGAKVFKEPWGHADRITSYSLVDQYVFRGVGVPPMTNPGHVVRYDQDWGGASNPFTYQGITAQALASPGHAPSSAYGYDTINEWKGVPASKALGV